MFDIKITKVPAKVNLIFTQENYDYCMEQFIALLDMGNAMAALLSISSNESEKLTVMGESQKLAVIRWNEAVRPFEFFVAQQEEQRRQ